MTDNFKVDTEIMDCAQEALNSINNLFLQETLMQKTARTLVEIANQQEKCCANLFMQFCDFISPGSSIIPCSTDVSFGLGKEL